MDEDELKNRTLAAYIRSLYVPPTANISHVDQRLISAIRAAAGEFPYKVEVTPHGGFNPRKSDTSQHNKGNAIDVQIYDADGKPIPNYQNAKSFPVYQQFANKVHTAWTKDNPDAPEAVRWGGYFGGPKGKYGSFDLMHFDLGGLEGLKTLGGSWDKGLNQQQMAYYPVDQNAPAPTGVTPIAGNPVPPNAANALPTKMPTKGISGAVWGAYDLANKALDKSARGANAALHNASPYMKVPQSAYFKVKETPQEQAARIQSRQPSDEQRSIAQRILGQRNPIAGGMLNSGTGRSNASTFWSPWGDAAQTWTGSQGQNVSSYTDRNGNTYGVWGGGGNNGGGGLGSSKVLCSFYMRKGWLPVDIWKADTRYSATVHPLMRRGYLLWADPLVRYMDKGTKLGKCLANLLWPVVRAWAREMAHRGEPDKFPRGSMVGKAVLFGLGSVCLCVGYMERVFSIRAVQEQIR